jgi:myo-inositol-1(or 4)-monophosphatase
MFAAELEQAKKAAVTAGEYLDGLSLLGVQKAEGRDIKLEADRESERRIMSLLASTGLSVLTEETGAFGAQEGLRWIIDPLDGTYNFFRGARELACVSVALWEGMKPLLGVVYRLGGVRQLIEGDVTRGQARLNGQTIRPSAIAEPAQAALATGFPVYLDYGEDNLYRYVQAARHFKKVRMLGSATLMSASVGMGQVDVYSEKSIKLWDIAAGAAISLAAGAAMRLVEMAGADTCHILLCANKPLLEASAPLIFG